MFIELTKLPEKTPILIHVADIRSVEAQGKGLEQGSLLHLSDPERRTLRVHESYRDIAGKLGVK